MVLHKLKPGRAMMAERDWDDAFANMAYVPGAAELPAQWQAQAEAFRSSGITWETIAYGPETRASMDLFWPSATPHGLAVFVHGGYWMKFDKSAWSHLAQGALERGWAVCMPSYTLAPEARISQMTTQIAAAINEAAGRIAGPIRLAGHSAGGHLVTRMVCDDSALTQATAARIASTLSISGLHDLRPLLHTKLNATLGLDAHEASDESAVLHRPVPGAQLTAWVGGDERPEFIRQAQLLDMMWAGLGAETACVVEPDHNHFTVIEALGDPTSALLNAYLGGSRA